MTTQNQNEAPPAILDNAELPGAYVMRPQQAEVDWNVGVEPVVEAEVPSAPTQDEPVQDLSYLALPEDFGIAPQPQPQLPVVPAVPNTPEAVEAAKKLGFTVEQINQFVATAQEAQAKVAKYENEIRQQRSLNQLQAEWGVDRAEFQQRMSAITERFKRYPQNIQRQLDSVEGAKLIYAYLQQQQQQAKPNVPQFQRSGTTPAPTPGSNQNTYLFTQAEIDKMSNDEYRTKSAQILQAYAQGRVKK